MNPSPIAALKPHSHDVSFNAHGLKVLLVINDFNTLVPIYNMLQHFHYQVTPCSRPANALAVLRNNEIKFDLVITEVDFQQDMPILNFLEIVQDKTDLPVVAVSDGMTIHPMEYYAARGVCALLLKPVQMGAIEVLWDHVTHYKTEWSKQKAKSEPNSSISEEVSEYRGSSNGVPSEGEQRKVRCIKHRLVWSKELHLKFLDAVNQIGVNNVVPKKIQQFMNVPGLTRGNISSHLQKYRQNLRKIDQMKETSSFEAVAISTVNSMNEHIGMRLGTAPGMEHN